MNNYLESLVIILIAIIFSPIILLIFLFYFLTLPLRYFNRKKFRKEYHEYLIKIEGHNFFCFNNRKKGLEYIEELVIPKLNDNIQILFINGKLIETQKYNNSFISHSLYNLKNYTRFPHLMKVRNGKIIDLSINRLMFDCKNQGKDINILHNTINEFFET